MINTILLKNNMKIKILSHLSALAMILSTGACTTSATGEDSWGDEAYEANISSFMAEYFPNRSYTTTGQNDDSSIIRVKNGPSITFDPTGHWISVVGYGETLPPVFLFDQLPPDLYEYVQGLEAINEVYSVIADHGLYSVDMLDSSVTYNSSTGTITQPANLVRTVSRISASPCQGEIQE